jgi:hypothetical protein
MEFLSEHKMDFNKVIRDGITYVNEIEEENINKKFQNYHKPQTTVPTAPTNDRPKIDLKELKEDQLDFLESTRKSFREWFELTNDATFDFPPQYPKMRRVLYEQLGDMFPGKVHLKSVKGNYGVVHIQAIRIEDMQQHVKEQEDEQTKRIDEALGFRRLIKLVRFKHFFEIYLHSYLQARNL